MNRAEATEKVPITAFLFIFSVTLFKNYRKRTLKILRSEVFQWPHRALRGFIPSERLRRLSNPYPEGLFLFHFFWEYSQTLLILYLPAVFLLIFFRK